jgi:hypothetical protein
LLMASQGKEGRKKGRGKGGKEEKMGTEVGK